jgi:hypothetical protein
MRYLKSKFQFLKDADYIDPAKHNKINEATNDITWGGSLIGRLINSAIRKRNISKAGSKIEPLVQEFKDYLDRLLPELSGEEDKNAMLRMLIYYLLLQIYRVVMSGQSVQVRLYILLTPAQYANSGTGPVNTSFNNRYSKYLKLNEAENKSDKNDLVGTLGLIERTITELKSSQLKTKDELISKLEGFRDEIMKIPFEKEGEVSDEVIDDILGTSDSGDGSKKEGDSTEDSDKEGDKEKESGKGEFYISSKNLIISYLKLIDQIGGSTVKKQSTSKVGDMVVWKQTTGEDKGTYQFGEIVEINPNKIIVNKLVDGKASSLKIPLEKEQISVLTHFDDDKYSKMKQKMKTPLSQTHADLLNYGISQARLAYYTYLHKNDKVKQDRYYKDIQDFSAALISQTEKKESFVFESETIISDKDALSSWNMIVSMYESRKDSDPKGFASHLAFLKDLLNKKINGDTKPKEAMNAILLLGASYLKGLKGKDAKIFESSQESLKQLLDSARKSIKEFENLEDNINKAADIMASISVPVLKLKDKKDFSEFKDANNKGVGSFIEGFINSFNAILSSAKKGKEAVVESFITTYERFRMINEAEEGSQGEGDSAQETSNQPTEQTNTDKDPIVVAWFKFFKKGDEKQWEIESDKAKEFKAKIEKEKMDFTVGGKTEEENEPSNEAFKIINESSKLPDDVEDPIMKIIDIFGRAYKLYSTEYIPSGRPGGRVSQKTLREYTFIGKGEKSADASREGDYYTPGRGPWAVKKLHDKWVSGIKSIISDSTYRVILANINFVSKAESKQDSDGSDTRQEFGKIEGETRNTSSKGSGIGLMEFITKMLYLTDTYDEAANALTRKYFNIEWISDDDKNKYNRTKQPRRTTQPATAEDKKPFFTPTQVPANSGRNLKPDTFFLFKITYTVNSNQFTKYWIAWIVKKHVGNNKLIFRMQETQTNPAETMIEKWHKAPNEMDRVRTGGGATPGVRLGASDKEVFLCIAKTNIIQNTSSSGENIYVLQVGVTNAGPRNVRTTNASEVESAVNDLANFFQYKIDSIENLNILCKNEDGGFYAQDTVITHQWNRANKVAPDVEINGTAVSYINRLTI